MQLLWGRSVLSIDGEISTVTSIDGLWRVTIWHNSAQRVRGCPYEVSRLDDNDNWFFEGRCETWASVEQNVQADCLLDQCLVCLKLLPPSQREAAHKSHVKYVCSGQCGAAQIRDQITSGMNRSPYWSRRRWKA